MHIISNDQVASKRRRREHSPELKRQLVERALEPGASVSAIALEAGINANLLFTWRREHREAMATAPAATLVPVKVEEPVAAPAEPTAPRPSTGTIEIDIAGARVRLRGAVDETSVRCVLQTLHALA